jgi:acyl carrier protein
MHEQTFVGNSLALERIQAGFPAHTSAGPGVLKAPAEIHSSTSKEIAGGSTELAAVLNKLSELLAQELHMRSGDIDERAQLVDLGLDSVTGVTWMRRINEHFGTHIEATTVYNHPTLAELARYVKVKAEQRALPSPEPAAVVRQAPIASGRARGKLSSWRSGEQARLRAVTDAREVPPFEPVAVIGMAGQFPKASGLEEFWTNIATGSNCIEEISRERWSLAEHYQEGSPVPGKTYSKWLGALPEYDLFDPLFFNISPTEAKCMDPQQRVFL